jgi:protein-disulfide isomerase|nr:DsbA family protein [Neorhizobium tomejilense]
MKTSKGLLALLALTTAINIGIAAGNYRIYAAGSAPVSIGDLSFDPDAKSTLVPPPSAGTAPASATDAEIDALINKAEQVPVPAFDEAAVRSVVRDEIRKDPQFILDAINAHIEKQQAEEAEKADKKLVDMASLVTESKDYPFIGNKDGKVELYYYFDINCGYCKKIDADLDRFMAANPDVKIVHREMPILTAASRTAANIGGTLFALYPEGYAKFHRTLLGNKAQSDPSFIEQALIDVVGKEKAAEVISKSFNIKEQGVAQGVDARIKTTLQTATDAGITGTPFIYVKGDDEGFIRGADPELFDRLSASAAKLRG